MLMYIFFFVFKKNKTKQKITVQSFDRSIVVLSKKEKKSLKIVIFFSLLLLLLLLLLLQKREMSGAVFCELCIGLDTVEYSERVYLKVEEIPNHRRHHHHHQRAPH